MAGGQARAALCDGGVGVQADPLADGLGLNPGMTGLKGLWDQGRLAIVRGVSYPRPDHSPATYTILNFPVDDISAAVDALTARGVVFERYAGMAQDERGILRDPSSPPIAWFRDPAGNTLAVLET